MLHFLRAGHLDLSFEYPAAGHKVTPYTKSTRVSNIQLTLSTLAGNFNKFILTKSKKPSLQQGYQLKKISLLDIYLGFQIQVPIQYYDDLDSEC